MNDQDETPPPDHEMSDDDLEVTRDPTPAPALPRPDMSAADETIDSAPSSDTQPKSHGSLPPLPPPPDDAPVVPGYHLLHKLGEGGMGVVWKALQLATRREVALKLLSPAAFGSDTARLRFQREVELAARLEHPFIARVYDSSPADQPATKVIYYAMELVAGHDLETHVRMHGLKTNAILTLMRNVCLGVQHAHQRGVIHRDLKPSNILVVENQPTRSDATDTKTKPPTTNASGLSNPPSVHHGPTPKIVDFGLAKTTTPEDGQITLSHVGQVAGTPAYMSPEQAAGQTDAIDTRTDVYALGVILYRLLTGKYPHDTTVSFANLLRHISEDEVVRPRAASEDASKIIDRELETLLLKALEKDPDRRYDNAGALAADLDNYMNDNPLNARPASVSYLIRRRLVKYRKPVVASVAVLSLAAVVSGAAAWQQYNKKELRRINTTPSGALVVLNGVPQRKCGLTPCVVELPRGKHVIEIVHEDLPYAEARREITVAWGRSSEEVKDNIVLMPKFRTLTFDTEPSAVEIVLSNLDHPESPKIFVKSPATSVLPEGNYSVQAADTSMELVPIEGIIGSTITVVRGLEPLSLRYRVKPIASDKSAE